MTTMTAQRRRVELDWAGPHTTLTGTLQAAAGLVSTAQLGFTFGVSPLVALPLGVVGALAVHTVTVKQGLTGATQFYRFACWLGATAWLYWTLATTPYQVAAYTWVVVLGLAAGVLAPGFARVERNADINRTHRMAILSRDRIALDWESRMARVTKVAGLRVANIQMWDGDPTPGCTLDWDLPLGGHKWRDFITHCDSLASDAGLPNGCGVEVREGHNRRSMLMRISFINTFSEYRTLPTEHQPASILNPVWWARQRNDEPMEADLRQKAWCVIGQRESGKTTHLHVVIRGVVRCVDAVCWILDLNAGALGVPWALPWWQGRAPRPAVDWIAGNEREAEIMTEAALAVALDRKVTGRIIKQRDNVTLLPVSPELPAIIIIGDEMAEILSALSPYKKIRDNVAQIIRIARDSAVNWVLSVLRGTTDVIDSGIKKQCAVWTIMRVSDDNEIGNSIGWNTGVSTEDLPYPGCGATVREPGGTATPWRGPDARPSDVDACAVAVAGIRPDLDDAAVAAIERRLHDRGYGDDLYATRWDRNAWLFDGEAAEAAAVAVSGGETGEDMEGERNHDPVWDGPAGGSAEDAIRHMDETTRSLRREQADAAGGQDTNTEFEEIVEPLRRDLPVNWADPSAWPDPEPPADSGDGDDPPASGGDAVTDARGFAWAELKAAGRHQGLTVGEILAKLHAAGFNTHRATVHDWVNRWKARSWLRQSGSHYYITTEGIENGE